MYFVAVHPGGTTKECAACGVSTEKPCGAVNISVLPASLRQIETRTRRGTSLLAAFEMVGVGHSEATPVETALPVDTSVSAKRVVEAGSPTLKERTASAVSE